MDRQIKKTLWTHDFIALSIGSVPSAIADVAMSFLMSVIVYYETQSTFLSGIFLGAGLIPNIIIPIVAGPFVDAHHKKNFIVILDFLMASLFLLGSFLFGKIGFNYGLFMLFDIICGCMGGVYQVAYEAYFPSLIPTGFEQKGYSVSSMIYPTVSVFFTPIAALLYSKRGLPFIMFAISICLFISSLIESMIKERGPKKDVNLKENPLKAFLLELRVAREYLKKETGLNRWYINVAVGGGMWKLREIMAVAWFTINPALGLILYSYLNIAEFAGRSVGGFFNYNVKFKNSHKTAATLFVYVFYEICDSILLFVSFPIMLVMRAACGFLGSNSAVLRASAVQNYIPDEDRGKINSLLGVRNSIFIMVVTSIGGALGDLIGIRETVMIACAIGMLSIFVNVFLKRKEISEIFMKMPDDISNAKFVI
ncbi:MAG: MFS transporter [Spirochaetales bacterium]|nr:MFS transporter [Spirochaetales bacterium]